VSKRSEDELRLRESEERFRATFDQAAVGISHSAPDGRWLRVNQKLSNIVGYTQEELLEKTFQDITHPDDLEANLEQLRQLLDGEIRTSSMEKRYFRKDGSIVWVYLTVSLVREPSGEPKYFIAVIEDINERKQAEEALQASLKELADLKFAIDEAAIVAFTDQRGRITYANDKFCQISKYSKEELVGQDHRIINSGYHPKEYIRNLWRTIDRGYVWRGELKNRAKDATHYWVDTTIVPFLNERGRPYQYVAIHSDITAHKAAEENLAARTHQQAAVADLGMRALAEMDLAVLMDEAVALVARTLDVEYCRVLELLSTDELLLRANVGWKDGLVGSTMVKAGLDSQEGYTLLVGEPVIVEDLRTERRFSVSLLLHEHEVVSSMSAVIHGRDKPFGVLGAYTTAGHQKFTDDDVNFLQSVANVLATAVEREEAEEALREVREADRERIARDLHDEALQDLTYTLAEMQLVQAISNDPGLNDRLERAVQALERVGQGVRGTIQDLRLEGGDQDRNFVKMLESLVELNRRRYLNRDIRLDVEDSFPSTLLGERGTELLRIVQEALANARRHSGASSVWVAAGDSGGKLWVEVSDDGRGFDPAKTPAGMGLRGMRERTRTLGGDLKIKTQPGEGVTVRFELALEKDGKEPEEKTRVILVEDHLSFRQAAASLFEQDPEFAVVGQAGSLAEARGMLEGGVDVAVVDLGLPDGYGGDLIRELRAHNPQAQALVLTASLDQAEIARAVESGAAGVLHKSAGMDEVVEAVRRLRAGETLLPLEEVVELLRFAGFRREQEHEARQAIAQLTPREREVLQALAEGLDGPEIAERLNISIPTERNHMASILAKLGVHSRLQALVFALRYGVVDVR
jgi:PAS domain S-box-containing protein